MGFKVGGVNSQDLSACITPNLKHFKTLLYLIRALLRTSTPLSPTQQAVKTVRTLCGFLTAFHSFRKPFCLSLWLRFFLVFDFCFLHLTVDLSSVAGLDVVPPVVVLDDPPGLGMVDKKLFGCVPTFCAPSFCDPSCCELVVLALVCGCTSNFCDASPAGLWVFAFVCC